MPWALFTEFSSACSLLFEKAEGIFREYSNTKLTIIF